MGLSLGQGEGLHDSFHRVDAGLRGWRKAEFPQRLRGNRADANEPSLAQIIPAQAYERPGDCRASHRYPVNFPAPKSFAKFWSDFGNVSA